MSFIDRKKFNKTHTETEEQYLNVYIGLNQYKNNTNTLAGYNVLLTEKKFGLFMVYSVFYIYINLWCFLQNIWYNLSLSLFLTWTISFIFSDMISALVHIYLDNSKIVFDGTITDFNRLGFQVHHLYPNYQWLMDDDYHPQYECNTIFPLVIILSILNNIIFGSIFIQFTLAHCLLFQFGHYCCHAITHGKKVPLFVYKLQKLGILIKPLDHQNHHKMLVSDYAILNGWTNPLLNVVFRKRETVNRYIDFLDSLAGYFKSVK